ncbi:protein O-GlcNAcase-like isoform X2 [Oppia nitens]|uniref:protein O-GlcNAcase-like isoform X2 n=1 Tax=Oppia nitens TaxID=1686743 RepID=UPI0023DC4632|nr:protein O-GlcNAcase-like isoform X2 [Oppia nitens]
MSKMTEECVATMDVKSDIKADTKDINDHFICGVVEGFYGRPWTASQRKDLFIKLKRFGLNTYMYAPKDDLKHRAYWRELYTVEEADQLSVLINAAKESSIEFIYALSPGLDISYSSAKDMLCLKRKLEQVSQFGCNAFALLFDDIEPEISESDKEVFQSFASAQVSVSNEIYQSLGQPRFLFCPTEYCNSRAVPNVQNSEYLNTIGRTLMSGIDVMWTGSKVITHTLTVQSIQELSEVLRRPPVIWDNLHANDYDQKRIFLGPYSGRSTDLIPHLRGVLTNPNCEYEPNFIPIHTLAQWSKCKSDAKCQTSSISSDIKLEAESDNGLIEDIPMHLSPTAYHPKKALRLSITEWLSEFNKQKTAYGRSNSFLNLSLPPILPIVNPLPLEENASNDDKPLDMNTASSLSSSSSPTTSSNDSNADKTTEPNDANELIESAIQSPKDTNQILEPMDCNTSPNLSPKHTFDAQMEETNVKNDDLDTSPQLTPKRGANSVDSGEEMQTECCSEIDDETRCHQLTYEDISLLIDLFYLPFEHGGQGLQFLNEFHWLKANGFLVSEFRRKITTESEGPEVSEWYARAAKFDDMTASVGRLLTKLTFCKNRSLLYDLYPYVWDIKGVISLLNSYVKWLGFSKGYREAFQSGDQEPWVFRGGLTAELQRLLPVETVSDLFLYKAPESPSSQIYTIRPYLPNDESHVYDICRKTFALERENITLEDITDFVGDRLVGGFLSLTPEYCFIVEDEMGICGYALAAIDAQQFNKKLEISWTPELSRKYPAPTEKLSSGQKLSPVEQMIHDMHSTSAVYPIPDVILKSHPSVLKMSVLPHIMDLSVPKRILACIIAALKANGSVGVFSEISSTDKKLFDFYSKLGFLQIQVSSDCTNEMSIFMGRVI